MEQNRAIEVLGAKVQRLIDENRMLRAELKKRASAYEKAALGKRKAEEKALELEKRLRTLDAAGALAGAGGDTKAARQRVNKLLREIDQCIALLNR